MAFAWFTIGSNYFLLICEGNMKKLLAAMKAFVSPILFAVPIVAGGLLLFWASMNRSTPEKLPEEELARALRVLEIKPLTIVPRAIGFGESSPSQFFQATAEVKGKIKELHPELKAGSFIREGELLIAIDTSDIEISIQKLKAEIARSEASLAELKTSQQNLEAALAIETSSLDLAKRELNRLQKLAGQNSVVSVSEVDQQRRSVLAQQQSVQNLQNSLNLLPAQIQSAEAAIAVSNANLASSQRDLERCRITAPFNCRLGPVDLELSEFVASGQQLLTAQSIDKIEVEAQFGLDKVANLIRPNAESPKIDRDPTAPPQKLVREFFDVEATVRYGAGDIRAAREARFERLREQLDSQARTVGIVVSIERPYEKEGKARQNGPPPVPGTYCEVELRGKPLTDSFVIPRSAIREGAVFIVDGDNRLRKREVEILLVQGSFASVKSGLSAGDRVVVSDPTPAIEGMLVDPKSDNELWQELQLQSGGSQ